MTGLDIVIVNYNSGEGLRYLLNSIALSKLDSVKLHSVVVVDNASRDDSAKRLNQALPLIMLRGKNIGYGAACNLGAKACKSQLLLFLNADIVLYPNTLEMACAALRADKGAGALGVRLMGTDRRVQKCPMNFPTVKTMLFKSLGLTTLFPARFKDHFRTDTLSSGVCDCVLGAFLLMRRKAFDQVKGFDQDYFIYYEEIDLIKRMSQFGWKCVYNSAASALHFGGASTSQTPVLSRMYSRSSKRLYAQKYFTPLQQGLVRVGACIERPLSALKNSLLPTRYEFSGV